AMQEASLRRRRVSVMLGAIGLAVLFGSAIATIRFPGAIVPLLVLMVMGVVLLVVAFFLLRTSMAGILEPLEK
ncbi:MAG: hypothetical protein ACREDF_02010, partial [Thermoplasmata archaeon]